MPGLKNKVPDLGVKVPDPKLEVRDLRSGGIRLNLTPGPAITPCKIQSLYFRHKQARRAMQRSIRGLAM